MIHLAAILALAGCYLKQLPVTTDVVRASSDVDMDPSCQQNPKARGWCSTFEPAGVVLPGEAP